MTAPAPTASRERLPIVVITTALPVLPLVLPVPAVAVTFGGAAAVFAGACTVAPLLDAPVDPLAAGLRGAAAVLAVLGGSLAVVATLGALSVPVLFTTFVAATVALTARGTWPGRNAARRRARR